MGDDVERPAARHIRTSSGGGGYFSVLLSSLRKPTKNTAFECSYTPNPGELLTEPLDELAVLGRVLLVGVPPADPSLQHAGVSARQCHQVGSGGPVPRPKVPSEVASSKRQFTNTNVSEGRARRARVAGP